MDRTRLKYMNQTFERTNTKNNFEKRYSVVKLLICSYGLKVLKPSSLGRHKKILGYFSLDVATVWSQPDHQFCHKWAILGSPANENLAGTRGYLKVNISIQSKGEAPKIPRITTNTDEIEGNLLLPQGVTMQRQRANFIFDIYRAENLVAKDDHTNRALSDAQQKGSGPDCFVEIKFAGSKVRTTTKKNNCNPVWDERLIITEPFPPLCQRIRIVLHFAKSKSVAYRFINIQSISNDKEHGFLPTFGPTLLHFYDTKEKVGYVGSVLLEINTELLDMLPANIKLSGLQATSKKSHSLRFQTENIFLFATIFDVTTILKKFSSKPVSFKITQGHINAQPKAIQDKKAVALANTTPAKNPKRTNKNYWYLPFDETKPCLYLTSTWPNFKKRMYNSNMLQHISDEFKSRLDIIQELFDRDDPKSIDIESHILAAIDYAESSTKKYIDLLLTYGDATASKLDKERLAMCKAEMGAIAESLRSTYHPRTKKKCLRKMEKIQKSIEWLIEDAQDSLPDIFIWMYSGKSKVAFATLPARKYIYSAIQEEKGSHCGEVIDIFFFTEQHIILNTPVPLQAACQMKFQLWLGAERHLQVCNEIIPEGFSVEDSTVLPESLNILERHTFQGRAHIFQGRFMPGADKTGLCDPFVRIILDRYSKETKIIKHTLNPVWDETLHFREVILAGSKKYIKTYPPRIFIEVFDQDELFRKELVGRAIAYPLIKFKDEEYGPPNFPPQLVWKTVYNDKDATAEILLAFELLEISGDPDEVNDVEDTSVISRIPVDIKPELVLFKVEVLFWGMRELKKVQLSSINKPRMSVLCSGEEIHSDTIKDAKKNPNFQVYVQSFYVILPLQEKYIPPVTFKLFDSRNFGIYVYAGTYMANVKKYMYHPLISTDLMRRLHNASTKSFDSLDSRAKSVAILIEEVPKKQVVRITKNDKFTLERLCKCIMKKLKVFLCIRTKRNEKPPDMVYSQTNSTESDEDEQVDIEDFDWWTKFYASLQGESEKSEEKVPMSLRNKLIIYPNELEKQSEFDEFTDMLQKFQMYKGKRTGDDDIDADNITGIFKGSMRIYRWPTEKGIDYVTESNLPLENGVFQDFPSNKPLKYLLRVYCVRAIELRPKDFSGKSDPYLVVTLNDKIINDREHVVKRQLNPVFGRPFFAVLNNEKVDGRPNILTSKCRYIHLGCTDFTQIGVKKGLQKLSPERCFEFSGIFPLDHTLTISVWDYDMTTQDDLVGETKIDIENRFYTHCRANCGLPESYQESGYCEWRDQYKPTFILDQLARRWNLGSVQYKETSVVIGSTEFRKDSVKLQTDICSICGLRRPSANGSCSPSCMEICKAKEKPTSKEVLALTALRRWHLMPVVGRHLVPEHVETRSLYNPRAPGIEQGKIQMWIDIFPDNDMPPPKQVNIEPRKPVAYELRVIIWNTEEIKLNEDDFFAGEKKSDIYVKGWLTSPEEAQFTDVHYRSLTGEGNFNWRFVFPFEYLSTENKLVLRKKDTLFALDKTEYKIPCQITLQVWDNDTFSADDFLGSLTLELSHLNRGAPSADKCIYVSKPKTLNLFKIRRTKGWWPFLNTDKDTGQVSICGKLEAEFELVTASDADNNPVGLGRDDPRGLPKPNRPDTSFGWFNNPFKAFKYVICHMKCRKCCRCILIIIFFVMIGLTLYAIPGYTVKKILGV